MLLLGCVLVLVNEEIRRNAIIRSGLGCVFLCTFLVCRPCCMPPWLPLFWVSGPQRLGRAPGPEADLLVQETYKYALHQSNCPLPWQSWQPSDLPGCFLLYFLAFPPSFSIPCLSLSLLEELKTELEIVALLRGSGIVIYFPRCSYTNGRHSSCFISIWHLTIHLRKMDA